MVPLALVMAALAVSMVQHAAGHGFLLQPMSRNIQSYYFDNYTTKEDTPQWLAGGGVGVVGANGAVWPSGPHGVCGDAASTRPQKWMVPRAVTAQYIAGQIATLQVVITADHRGRFSFQLCPDQQVTEECFARPENALTRADAVLLGGKFWYLAAATAPSGDGSHSKVPYPNPLGPDVFSSAPTYQLQFKLPEGISCSNCVLRWYWTTGNSCSLPCDPADPDYNPTTSCDPRQLGTCGRNAHTYPEEFWNCADISISAGPRNGTASPPPPPPQPSPLTATASPLPPPTPFVTSPSPPPTVTSASCSSSAFLASFCAGTAAGLYACPSDSTCTSYINCAGGQGWLQPCSPGLRFNPTTMTCDWPYNVPCDGAAAAAPPQQVAASPPPPLRQPPPPPPPQSSTSSPPPPPSGTSPCNSAAFLSSFCSGGATGLYACPSDPTCSTYVSCASGQGWLQSCGVGLLFNPTALYCDWPQNVRCSSSTTTAAAPPPSPPPMSLPPPPSNGSCRSLVGYWGQNSVSGWSSQQEGSLASYCTDSTYDIIVVGFANVFFDAGNGGKPTVNLANHCETTFPGTNLLSCPLVAADIQYCQSHGKKILMSLGGAIGTYGFTSDAQAQAFAGTVWSMFLGGNDPAIRRPFGVAVMDGIDLDIEGGSSAGYSAFLVSLRTLYASGSRQYFISGAPQCVFPDAYMGPGQATALQSGWFDFVFIQFYNNWCGVQNFNNANAFNFGAWANWAATTSTNPNVKLFLGVPASPDAAGSGYVPPNTVAQIATSLAAQYPRRFGGVMVWDVGNSGVNVVDDKAFGAAVSQQVHQMC